MNSRLLGLLAGVVLALAWPIWLPWISLVLVVDQPFTQADAIVPLAGGHERVRYAAELVHAGYAPLLVTTDIGAHPPFGRLASRYNHRTALGEGIQPAQIIATTAIVSSTYSELQAVRVLAEREGWRSIMVVTSPEHTRRSAIIAGEVFRGSSIRLSVHPVRGYGYNPALWWENPAERRLVLGEYPKIAAFVFGYRR